MSRRRGSLCPLPEALSRLLGLVADHFRFDLVAGAKVVLIGHNVGFDIGFLRRLCRLAGAPFPALFSHRSLDMASVLRFLSLAGVVPSSAVASAEAFIYFGLRLPGKLRHTALGDARATADLLTRLVGLVHSD